MHMTSPKQLTPFFEAIGELCNEWAHLEQWVSRLFLSVGQWDYRLPNALSMVSLLDLRVKIAAIKIGVINLCSAGDFLENVLSSLNYIDKELTATRNRFIHDIWAAADNSRIIRTNMTPKQLREPGSGVRTVQEWEPQYTTIDEVREVIDDIVQEREYLGRIVACFQNPQDTSLQSQLLAQPQRLHLRRQQERQRQMNISRGGQKSPPKPSPR